MTYPNPLVKYGIIAIAIGEKFHRLTFLGSAGTRTADNHIVGSWQCECGNKTDVAVSRVKNGYTRSCGCLVVDLCRAQSTTHGMRNTPEYSSWSAMKGRCLDPNNKDFPRWGGVGITICPEWIASFEAFYAHIGPRPLKTTLDRIDGTKGYEPGNVRWATAVQQAQNRKDSKLWEIDGLFFESAQAAADHFGVSDQTIHRWVKGAFDPRRNSFTPKKDGCNATLKY